MLFLFIESDVSRSRSRFQDCSFLLGRLRMYVCMHVWVYCVYVHITCIYILQVHINIKFKVRPTERLPSALCTAESLFFHTVHLFSRNQEVMESLVPHAHIIQTTVSGLGRFHTDTPGCDNHEWLVLLHFPYAPIVWLHPHHMANATAILTLSLRSLSPPPRLP